MWAAVLFLSIAAGCSLAYAMLARAWEGPRWTLFAAAAAIGVLFGPGLCSILFFDVITAEAATPAAAISIPVLLLAAFGFLAWKCRTGGPPPLQPGPRFRWTWVLAGALVAGGVLVALDIQAAAAANPDGEWDASAIWNLRGRFLAAGPFAGDGVWRRAISADIGGALTGSSHPGYPLLLSSFLAMQWTAAGSYTSAVPVATGAAIALALPLLLVAGTAARRSTALGLLAGLALIATELFSSQAAAQYADLLQGLAFLAALILLDLAAVSVSPTILAAAGLAIGFAPWIKNEGQPFAIAALTVAAWRFRTKVGWILVGAVPGILATAALKLMSEGREAMFPSTLGIALAKLANLSRWSQSLAGFGKGVFDAGPLWAHPILLIAALAVALRFVSAAERRARVWLAVPIAATLAAEYGLYLITTADLTWHISTSVERLLVQVWPSLLWLFFSMLRAPEEYFAEPPQVVAPKPAKRKRTQA